MGTAAFTLEQYNALNNSIAQGTLTVTYGDKTVTYRTLDEMLRIRNIMMSDLGLLPNNGSRKLATFSKNWKK